MEFADISEYIHSHYITTNTHPKNNCMKVICIGNYPPRQCGIATFTANLLQAIMSFSETTSKNIEVEVIAMNDSNQDYDYPPVVSRVIHDKNKGMYEEVAEYINNSGAAVCLLQHEYGIFGGASGVLLLGLLRRLQIPIVVTFHTVLQKPGFHEREVLRKIALYAWRIVVMNSLAIGFLKEVYDVPPEKVVLIPHGVPDFEVCGRHLPAPPPDWQNRTVMMTFGLIGRSKGIEVALKSLPELVKIHPDLLYVIAGKTHPNIVKNSGEEYRSMLQDIVISKNLEGHVQFIDRYLNEEELMSYLQAADLYVTPYHNKAQITSGTLSYAVAGGCAVLSTPYWHAEELLSNDLGMLFGFGDSKQLAEYIDRLLNNRQQLSQMKESAYNYGKTTAWPLIGEKYTDLLHQSKADFLSHKIEIGAALNHGAFQKQYSIPAFDPAPLLQLTDDTGILQHANGCVPCYKTGYCLDDNARALVLSLMALNSYGDKIYETLASRYLAYIQHMHIKDSVFFNYLTYDRKHFDHINTDDAAGRAIWALGCLVRFAPNDGMFQVGLDLFIKVVDKLRTMHYARGFANSIFGLNHYTTRFPDQEKYLHLMVRQAQAMCEIYHRHKKKRWHWFEDRMTYDNGLLPAALYIAWDRTGMDEFREVADESTAFLETKCFAHDYLTLIGNKRWLGLDENYEIFAQQPVDAMAMVILYDTLYRLDKNDSTAEKLRKSFLWFLGYNDLDLPLFDCETKGCNDGIEAVNINRNQGAESVIAYMMAHLISRPYFD